MENSRESFRNNGGVVSPMNTEACRKYLQEKANRSVEPEDVLWLLYHVD